ncbi:hypothetical protein B0H14DRAFT_3147996 [Mycena olivaceomarginata]|nr:hypothetical protein B0H14DRAFT_3147996 [Mycena olivaceomarginata]
MSEEPPTSAANPVQQALLPVVHHPKAAQKILFPVPSPCLPCLSSIIYIGATSIADESGSDWVIMLDEIVVKQRARWDYKTNMTLRAHREHSGRKTSIDEGDPVFVQD